MCKPTCVRKIGDHVCVAVLRLDTRLSQNQPVRVAFSKADGC